MCINVSLPEELMERLGQQALRRCREHDPQNCANAMQAYGVPVVGGSPVIDASSKRATEVISEFACQSLANTGWSLTNSSATGLMFGAWGGQELLSSVEVQVGSLISRFDSSDHSEKELRRDGMWLRCKVVLATSAHVSDRGMNMECELLEFSMGLLGFFWAFAFLEVSCALHSRGRALLAEIGQILDRSLHRRGEAAGRSRLVGSQVDGKAFHEQEDAAEEAYLIGTHNLNEGDVPPYQNPFAVVSVSSFARRKLEAVCGGAPAAVAAGPCTECVATCQPSLKALGEDLDHGCAKFRAAPWLREGTGRDRILCGVTFSGMLTLRWQLDTYQLERQHLGFVIAWHRVSHAQGTQGINESRRIAATEASPRDDQNSTYDAS
ncbi:unnamed protein product [Symbiodinium microadriaticum]|nr:unnamed protein product [Symbiodinium microadriaticum]